MAAATILVVDDEQLIRWSLTSRLSDEGYKVVEAATAADALKRAREGVDLVLLDYRLPDSDGLSVLKQIKEHAPDTLVILLTAYSSVETAVEAMRQGAYHYVNKPFNLDEIALLVAKALETTALRREVRALRASQAQPYSLDRIVGDDESMQAMRALLKKIAAGPGSTVLLTGESGTGKDLAAKVIHYASQRASKPFMNITCSALPETLLESELFGHERGAFTGADRQKRGLIEMADGGTVFLDEIGEMVPLLQAKLLRFLEEKSFKRVGGSADIRVDVRVIAATNRNLEEEVQKGHFRSDLYYRLNVVPITAAATAAAPQRHSAPDQLLRRPVQHRVSQAHQARDAVGHGAIAGLRLAGQRARAAKRRRAGDPARRRRRVVGGPLPAWRQGVPPRRRRRIAGERDGSRTVGAIVRGAGARAQRLESNQGRDAAGTQPGSDPLPDREVQTGAAPSPIRKEGRNSAEPGYLLS